MGAEKILNCIYNIPLCGGWCAPTKNPDPSCWRHFSNEFTVPAAAIYLKVAPYIEWSTCCIKVGRCGLDVGINYRKLLMGTATVLSIISLILTCYPVFAISKAADLIIFGAWAKGTASVSLADGADLEATTYIGLLARVEEIDCKQSADEQERCEETVIPLLNQNASVSFDSAGDGLYRRVFDWSSDSCGDNLLTEACEECRDSATGSVTFAIMGMLTMIPQITTDLQRTTSYGDVNCQATMGFLTSAFGLFSNGMSLQSFAQSCWAKLPDESTPPTPVVDKVVYEWGPGTGFICLAIACALKAVDSAIHFVVPTPAARSRKPEPVPETTHDFLLLAVDDELLNDDEQGKPVSQPAQQVMGKPEG